VPDRLNKKELVNKYWMAAVPYIVFIVITIIIVSIQPGTIGLSYLSNKTDAAITLILVAAGQTLVLITGGFDLSVGGVICVTNSLIAVHMQDSPGSIFLWTTIALLIGIGVGTFNGVIVAKTKMQPFIVTLATQSVCLGVALLILKIDGGKVPASFMNFFLQRFGGIPISIIVIAILIVWWIYFKRTPTGISLYAVGSNANAARLNGISLTKTYVLAYAMSGLFAAIAGIYRSALMASGSPTAGAAFTMSAICAAVIGGTAISGGIGGLVGSIIGALIIRGITELLVFLQVSSYWTLLVQGLLLVLAVAMTSYVKLRRKGGAVQ